MSQELRAPGWVRWAVAGVAAAVLAIVSVEGLAVALGGIRGDEVRMEPLPMALLALLLGALAVVAQAGRRRAPRGAPLAIALALGAAGTAASWAAGLAPPGASLALLVTVPIYGLGLPWLARRLPSSLDAAGSHRGRLVAWSLLAVLTLFQTVRFSAFMVDPELVWGSAFPLDPKTAHHMCLAAYVRAGQLVRAGSSGLYDPSLYEPSLGRGGLSGAESVAGLARYQEDVFLYPPPFLILPVLALSLTSSLLVLRSVWFALQATGFAVTGLALAGWIRGREGLAAGLLLPAVWISVPILFELQYGQFQLAATSLAVGGMLLITHRRGALGGVLLGIAVWSKIFPGVLLLLLLFQRRLRELAWGVGGMIAFGLLGLAVLGPAPFEEYFGGRVLALAGGAAASFGDSDLLSVANDVSIYSLVAKLDRLGLPGMSAASASALSWLYTLVVVAAAWVAARHSRGATPVEGAAGRLAQAQVWLALLNLAALRSPVAPGVYVLTGSLWLLSLLLAERRPGRRWLTVVLVVSWLLFLGVPPLPSKTVLLLWALGSQTLCLGLNLWASLRSPMRPDAPAVSEARLQERPA